VRAASQDGIGAGRPAGSLARPIFLGKLGRKGQPRSFFGPTGPTLTGPMGGRGRPTSPRTSALSEQPNRTPLAV
jgi:hypothetical protein